MNDNTTTKGGRRRRYRNAADVEKSRIHREVYARWRRGELNWQQEPIRPEKPEKEGEKC